MQNGVHFISGLPRSGSTLLAAILRQNPAVHAGIVSPVGALVTGLLREVSQGNETALMIEDHQREALLRGLFTGYYQDVHGSKTIFDTNRGWCARTALLAALYPDAKIICCVRHIPWIIDSIERLIRQNRFELSKLFDFDPGGTVYSRAEALMAPNALIGFAVRALKQAMHSAESSNLLLLPFETLTREPGRALEAVYAFTNLPPFQHDFEAVSFEAREFDARLGTPGLHSVRQRVTAVERESVLPPDLWARFAAESIWRDPAFNTKSVEIVV